MQEVSNKRSVFRRENSDFFVPSARHSAVFLESKNSSPFNSSMRRGSDVVAGLPGKYTGQVPQPVQWQPVRPRRERTEGDIVLHKSRQELRDSLQARRIDVEKRFSRDAERMRNCNPRLPTESNSTSSTEERQVSLPPTPHPQHTLALISL